MAPGKQGFLSTLPLSWNVVGRWRNHGSRGGPSISSTRLQTLIFTNCHSQGLVYPTPDIHFPDLKDTLTCLVQKLSLDELDDLKFMDYPAIFRHVESSTQHIVDKAISLVEPEVLDFQGKTLTPQL